MNRAIMVAAAYVAIAVITFGHSAANKTECFNVWTEKAYRCRNEYRIATAIGAAAIWPLYWSWEAFE